MAENKCPVAGRSIDNMDVLVVRRSGITHVMGMLEGMMWGADENIGQGLSDAADMLRRMLEEEET